MVLALDRPPSLSWKPFYGTCTTPFSRQLKRIFTICLEGVPTISSSAWMHVDVLMSLKLKGDSTVNFSASICVLILAQLYRTDILSNGGDVAPNTRDTETSER